ncbi:hypothetical protein JQ629_22820 [Bradyrhizobium sp. AUGA SZCCT0222]|uniref:DUF5681 domain-containing protein n=1 Tax=Bradyrhizobium sp. AUGA SZCCT0222 TaxID=2807668 RepID=UPI001BA4F1BC|nr:DUF5681 domain-containing protein [Bradyrhizobium sp. AUGA SZCCT0222]MBR1270312.1 hypothetical protein [Bradyrhizobium sp. AUGA SZCCT0222]
MANYNVGYGKPPTHSRFKQGVSGNPKGRPKREPIDSAGTITGVLNAPIDYREDGKIKQVSRQELGTKLLVQRAMTDVSAAAALLKARIKAGRGGDDAEALIVEVSGWWSEHEGQDLKSRQGNLAQNDLEPLGHAKEEG